MDLKVARTELDQIKELRKLFLYEAKFQFVYDKCHLYGWADTYLFTINGIKAGYGSVWGQSKRADRDAIFEFFLIQPFRKFSAEVFKEFHLASGATYVECQTNDKLLSGLAYQFTTNVNAEAVLFEDALQTDHQIPGSKLLPPAPTDHRHDSGNYSLELNGEVVATGGYLWNYNFPYADIYMDVKEGHRHKGYGTFIVQELKKEIYYRGLVPSARCNVKNLVSKSTLTKAGFQPCGHIVKGEFPIVIKSN